MQKLLIALSIMTLLLTSACSELNLSKDTEKNHAVEQESPSPAEESQDTATDPAGTEETDPSEEEETSAQEPNTEGSVDEGSLFVLDAKFFNEIETVNGLPTIQNPENVVALVNKEFALPENYKPQDLVIPNVKFPFEEENEKKYLRQEAADALTQMFEDAKQEDIILYAVSGFRSYGRQTSIFNWEVQSKGEEEARRAVAFPGQSEHQTGLAMDISSESAGFGLKQSFGEMKEGEWVAENAHKYGFIIRYPEGKEEITGYKYEPWHLRYVGQELAKIIYENDLTLEEYFEKAKKI